MPDGDRDRPEPKVLSDVAHEARNQFHKLYYCAELVRSAAGEASDGDLGVAAEMLERTLKALEKLTAETLEYVRPLVLEQVRINAADLGAALQAVLRAEVSSDARVSLPPSAAKLTVAIDPSRLSSALRAIAAQLSLETAESGEDVTVEVELDATRRDSRPVLELRLHLRSAKPPVGGRRAGLVDWALAVKVLLAHGGGVERGAAATGSADCTLWIPLVEVEETRRS
jgi:hypothetical protein